MSWFRSCCFVVLLLLGAVPVAAEEGATSDQDRLFAYGAWVELSAEGRVLGATLPPDTTLPALLHEPLRQKLVALVFEPARGVDGIPRPSRSWLQGHMRLVPKGDNYEIIVEADQLGPRPPQPFRIRVGIPPDQPVRLLLTFDVTAEGRTRNIQVMAMDRTPSGLTKTVADSVRSLRFEPEHVDGKPVATTLRLPFQARRNTSDELPFELPALARDSQRPGVPGQDAYAPPIVMTAELIRTGSLRF